MNRNKVTLAFIVLVLLMNISIGQQNLITFTEVKGQPELFTSHFKFSIADFSFRILANGRGTRTGGGLPVRTFNLRPPKDFRLDRVIYHAQYQDDILFICEITDDEAGGGFIARLDGRTLKMKWKRIIPAFNVGQGLVEGNYVYVTGIGFIGKINLESGAYVWRHDDLYRNSAFNSFELPEIIGNATVFRESEIYYRQRVAVVQVDKQSGRIISLDM